MKGVLVERSVLSMFDGLLSVSKAFSPILSVSREYANVLPKFQFLEKKEKHDVVKGRLRNGIRWAAGNVAGLMGSCTVMYQIGSRDELCDDLGATHFVRVSSMNSGELSTGFLKYRFLQQRGASLTVRTDRQSMAFTITCAPPMFDDVKDFLVDTGVLTEFEHYNLPEVRRFIHTELAQLPMEQHTLDLLQTASFTGGLSNSIFCPEERIDTMSATKLRAFMSKCGHVNCSVGGWGIPRGQVMALAKKLVGKKYSDTSTSTIGGAFAHRSGFEVHDTGRGSTTCIGLSVPAEGTDKFGTFIKYSIIASACGDGSIRKFMPVMRYLNTTLSIMDPTFSCRAFNLAYSNAGIFGFLLRAEAVDAGVLSLKLAHYFENILPSFSPEEFEMAKRYLLLATTRNVEYSCEDASLGLALAAALDLDGGLEDIHDYVMAVKVEDLRALANCIGEKCKRGQIAVAVVGDVEAVPIHDIQKFTEVPV